MEQADIIAILLLFGLFNFLYSWAILMNTAHPIWKWTKRQTTFLWICGFPVTWVMGLLLLITMGLWHILKFCNVFKLARWFWNDLLGEKKDV